MQGTDLVPGRHPVVCLRRLLLGALRGQCHDCVHCRVDLFNAGEVRGHDLASRDLPVLQLPGQLDRRLFVQGAHPNDSAICRTKRHPKSNRDATSTMLASGPLRRLSSTSRRFSSHSSAPASKGRNSDPAAA